MSDTLAAVIARDGFAVARAVIDPASISAARDAVAAVMAGVAGTSGATWSAMRNHAFDDAAKSAIRTRCADLAEVEQVAASATLLAPLCLLLGGDDVVCHPRRFLRMNNPATAVDRSSFPWHQDFRFVQGSPDTVTVWVPLDRCSGTGLDLVPGSHHAGLRPVERAARCALPCEVVHDGPHVPAPELEVGDALLLHSLTLHRTAEFAAGEGRVSLDLRYQRASDPISAASLISVGGVPIDDARFGGARLDYVAPVALDDSYGADAFVRTRP